MVIQRILTKAYCCIQMLRLWKRILYGDISNYHDLPEGSVYLTATEAFQIAWIVWME